MRNVTRHVTKRDTDRDMSRVTVHVSHATTTPPHYTLSLAEVVMGLSMADAFIHRLGSRGASQHDAWMAADAARFGAVR